MSKTKNLFESFQNNLKEDTESMKIDLDKEDKEFDKALNKFLSGTNSTKDKNYNINRENGWYYAKVKYKDNTDGYFYYHSLNNKCDAQIHGKDLDSYGMELNELIKKVNNNLNESTQANLTEAEEKINVFDIIDIDYVASGISTSKIAYLTGDISDIINSLKQNGCKVKNFTDYKDFNYCDVIYKNQVLNLDSFSNDKYEEISYILTGADFYYGGTTEYSKYEVSFTVEGNIRDGNYLKEEILDYLHRLESNVENAKVKLNNFNFNKVEE